MVVRVRLGRNRAFLERFFFISVEDDAAIAVFEDVISFGVYAWTTTTLERYLSKSGNGKGRVRGSCGDDTALGCALIV